MDAEKLLKQAVDGFAACIAFYTRIPAGRFAREDTDFAASQWATPLVGLIVGVIGWFFFWLAHALGLPASVSAALSLCAILLVTGCLHEDGVADMTDAFGGGQTRERKLEIMKDSRNGTFGVVALIMELLLRWAAMAALVRPGLAFWGLLAAHAGSRALFPLFMHAVRPAKPTGLAAGVGAVSSDVALYSAAIGGAILLVTLGFWPALAAVLALAVWFFGLKALCERQIGGHTGDVLGSLQQGAEIILLLVACASLA
ncbi:MAG: adenosylcobinamide-GDP ribazoletransferase [Rhizobiaceae bacterium]|nr:adenosylcobinamide-GDP ribazoletransferase [Rhizobiaceae bacterium]